MTIAFLIGAGATKAQYDNAPVCKDFLNKLWNNNSPHFSAMKDAIKSQISMNLEKWNIEGAMKKAYKLPSARKERFLHSLHMAISELITPTTRSDREYMSEYTGGRKSDPATHFGILFKPEGKLNKKDFFMTLNYDLYLDREVLYQQGKINYGLTKNEYFESEMTVVPEEEYSVYHLHGALNWEICNGDRLRIHMGAHYPKYTGVSNLCLVPPGYNKNHPLLKPIWKKAENRIRHADELIIIGCSLYQDDNELIDLLKIFIDKKGSENVKIIFKPKDIRDEYDYIGHCKNIIGNKFTYHLGFDDNAIDEFIFK